MNFYRYSRRKQWLIAVVLGTIGVLSIAWLDAWWKLFLLPIIHIPLVQFCFTPLLYLLGFYRLLSPTVYTIFPTYDRYDLHNASFFDYLYQFTWKDRGKGVQRKLLINYGHAFLKIIKDIEEGTLSEQAIIYGNSYFFNERTAQKLGFSLKKASLGDSIITCLYAVELILLHSFSQGKWKIPKFWRVKTMYIKGSKLCNQKENIEKILARLIKQ